MPSLKVVKTFRDVMNGHETAQITNLLDGEVVRKLAIVDGIVKIDAITVIGFAKLDDELTFEMWFMDRGNILFNSPLVPKGQKAKLCTQFDEIEYPNGDKFEITMD